MSREWRRGRRAELKFCPTGVPAAARKRRAPSSEARRLREAERPSAPREQSERALFEVFDQQHLVAELVVDHFVHNLPDDEHAEAAWPQAHLGPPDGTVHHGLRRARRCGVREPAGIEPAPRIAEVIDDGALGASGGDLDYLAR